MGRCSSLLIIACLVLCAVASAATGAPKFQGTIVRDILGTARVLSGISTQAVQGDPETVARNFLQQHHTLLKISDTAGDLRLDAQLRTPAGTQVRFTQMYETIPVFRGDVTVTTTDQGRVTMVVNNHRNDISLATTIPSYNPEQAIQYARQHLGAHGQTLGTPDEATLMIYQDENREAHLAYRVTVVCEAPYGDWELFLDAAGGNVLSVADRFAMRSGEGGPDGTGYVYLSDPLSAARQTYGAPGFTDAGDTDSDSLDAYRSLVPLKSLVFEDGVFKLKGPYCTITDIESPTDPSSFSALTPDGFRFTRNDPGFEAVMCYYHASLAYQRLLDLGFTIPHLTSIRLDPHGFMGKDNSHYSPTGHWASFGTGGVDDAEDADVIWHEYGHAIIYSLVPMWGGAEAGALGEGFCDYWAGSYSRSLGQWSPGDAPYNWIYNWDGHNEFWGGRVLDDAGTYPFGKRSIHDAGQIWSSALMSIQGELGRDVTDRLVLTSIFSLGSSPTGTDNALAILQADRDLYGGAHIATLRYWLGTVKKFLPADSLAPILFVFDDSHTASATEPKGATIVSGTSGTAASIPLFLAAGLPAGMTPVSSSFGMMDTSGLDQFRAIVLSGGLSVRPFDDPGKRQALLQYARGGGRVLVEGGEVGYRYRRQASGEVDREFREEILHVTDFLGDAQGADLLLGEPSPLLSSAPNLIDGPIGFRSQSTFADRDAMATDAADGNSFAAGRWTDAPGSPGIIVGMRSTGDIRTIYLPLSVSSITDSLMARHLIENALEFLLHGKAPIARIENGMPLPAEFSLLQNYPNPFNPATKIQFTIVNRQLTIVNVYDLVGREVATLVNEVKDPGTYTVQFDGSHLASGMYVVTLEAGKAVQTRRMMLIR
jgi:hypothetical protein